MESIRVRLRNCHLEIWNNVQTMGPFVETLNQFCHLIRKIKAIGSVFPKQGNKRFRNCYHEVMGLNHSEPPL